jgi:hypothetical protein
MGKPASTAPPGEQSAGDIGCRLDLEAEFVNPVDNAGRADERCGDQETASPACRRYPRGNRRLRGPESVHGHISDSVRLCTQRSVRDVECCAVEFGRKIPDKFWQVSGLTCKSGAMLPLRCGHRCRRRRQPRPGRDSPRQARRAPSVAPRFLWYACEDKQLAAA